MKPQTQLNFFETKQTGKADQGYHRHGDRHLQQNIIKKPQRRPALPGRVSPSIVMHIPCGTYTLLFWRRSNWMSGQKVWILLMCILGQVIWAGTGAPKGIRGTF